MGGYLAYTEYKDSGVEWLGKVPKHWKVLKIKRLTMVKRGASPRPIDDPKYFDDEGKYAWVRIADVTSSDRYLEKTTQRLTELGQSLSVALEPDDIFLSIAGSVGKPIITKIKCCIHDGFVYFPMLKEDREFLYYIFSSGKPYLGLGKLGTQLNLNTDTVGDIFIGLPPIAEQRSIARFLDYKTAQIDVLITKKETLLKKLAEKRTALISQAVTKGCDRAAPIKDSGIEWLGEIPAHWRIMHLKRAISSSDYGISDNFSASGIHPVLRMGNLQNEEITMDDVKYIDKVDPLLILKPNDILFNRTNSLDLVGKVALFRGSDKFEVTFASYLVRFRTNELADPEYLVFFLGREEVQKKASSMAWRAIGQANLNPNRYGYLEICLPPIKEQREILSYLKEKLNDLQQPIRKVQIAIAKLKEYRTALITNAVTGKIDVRDVMLEPEPVEAA